MPFTCILRAHPAPAQTFLTGLPLRPLGEMEVPSAIAAKGMVVTSAGSYTSYKEMWTKELGLQEVRTGRGRGSADCSP